jgi:hypothetical protein
MTKSRRFLCIITNRKQTIGDSAIYNLDDPINQESKFDGNLLIYKSNNKEKIKSYKNLDC